MQNLRELYEELTNAYTFGRTGEIFSLGTDLVSQCKENPFPENSAAHEVFFQAMRNYHLWTSGGINNRVSGRRLAKNIQALVELKEANPFPVVAEVKTEQHLHVLGIAPELVQEEHKEERKEEEHTAEDKKAFFNRHKRR